MSNANIKPTFGATVKGSIPTDQRDEVGAIWQRNSKTNQPYLTLRLNIPKSKLQEFISSATSEEININLVAFPNRHKESGDNRPEFRIYEELKK